MKILHLLYESQDDYFGIGGVAARAYEFYSRLCPPHEVTFVCKRYPGAVDGIKRGFLHIHAGRESRSLTVTLLSYALKAREYVYKYGHHYDLIVEEFSPGIPTFLFTYRKRPLILQVQGYTGINYFFKYNPLLSTVLFVLEKIMPPRYRRFIFVSEATKALYRLASDATVAIISNGIDRQLLDIQPEESDYILYLGRIDIHNKGLDVLLRAFREALRTFPSVKLKIAGDGRDRDRFIRLIQKYDLSENISILGWVEGSLKRELLRKALFTVQPSRYETQAITVLEAAASSKAVVVSNIPQLSYIVKAGGGMSFYSEDPQSLARAIQRLLKDPALRRRLGQQGRKYAENFTWEKMSRKYEEFLLSVLK